MTTEHPHSFRALQQAQDARRINFEDQAFALPNEKRTELRNKASELRAQLAGVEARLRELETTETNDEE